MVHSIRMRWLGAVLVLVAVGLVIAGCGGGGSSSSSESTGSTSGSEAEAGAETASSETASGAEEEGAEGEAEAAGPTATKSGNTTTVKTGEYEIELPSGKGELNIAFFMNASANEWQLAFTKGAEEQAKSEGDSITTFNANFDTTTQLNQITNAIQSGQYNSAVIVNIDGEAECDAITKQLPAAGILVSVPAQQACGLGGELTGPGMWAPGSLNYVGGDVSQPSNEAFVKQVGKAAPGKQNVLLVDGPPTASVTKGEENAVKQYSEEHPEFNVEGIVHTDYTTPGTYTAVLNYLQAHPEITLVMSVYSDCTIGVVQALKAIGKEGEIKVADQGGSTYSVEQIKAGNLLLTIPYFPANQARLAVKSLQEAAREAKVPPFISDVPAKWGPWNDPVPITKANVAEFTPEY